MKQLTKFAPRDKDIEGERDEKGLCYAKFEKKEKKQKMSKVKLEEKECELFIITQFYYISPSWN